MLALSPQERRLFPLYGTSLALRNMDLMSLVLMGVGFLAGLLLLGGLGWLAVLIAVVAWALGAFVPLQGSGMGVVLSLLGGLALYGLYWLVMWVLGLVGLATMLPPLVMGLLVFGLLVVAIALLFQPTPSMSASR